MPDSRDTEAEGFAEFVEDSGVYRRGLTYRLPHSFLVREVAPSGRAVFVRGVADDDDRLEKEYIAHAKKAALAKELGEEVSEERAAELVKSLDEVVKEIDQFDEPTKPGFPSAVAEKAKQKRGE